MLNKNRSSNIKIIYQSVKVPSSLVKAVTSNNSNDLIRLWDEGKAISRRIYHVELNKPIFNQIN